MDEAGPGRADLVLDGGAVYTVDPARPRAEAVAIRGGRVAAVGTKDEIGGLIGDDTQVIDVTGRMVLPAFQDAHAHPLHGALDRTMCELHDVGSVEEYTRTIAAYAADHPDAEWIVGSGWAMDEFPRGTPAREALDAIVADRPVFLTNRDYHGAWVNSRALELAGITKATLDPPDGRIERTSSGDPQGTLHEGAMDLVQKLLPATTPAQREAALLEAQGYLQSLGITSWQDAWVTAEEVDSYRKLAERDELTVKVVLSLIWDRHRGEEQIVELLGGRERGTFGRLKAGTVKIFQDGVVENFTAAMLEPYLDQNGNPTGNRGMSMIEPEALNRYTAALDAKGFQVHVHAIGDRAVREALDAFEAARAVNGPRDSRHHIAHLQVVHPDDIPRFAALGAVPNGQPFWACMDGQMRDLTIPFLGPERTTHQYPFASLTRAGARLAFGSDWPVSTPNPLLEIEVAVTRIPTDARDADPLLPDERLDLAACLEAFTMGAAHVNFLDRETGSITPGKLADLVVLDRNLFETEGPIGEARVLLTLAEGHPVYVGPGIGF